ncbi:hypothetical protein BDN72DRAFT_877697 [Pluteus cervinus]|uniref:Uncharacterized protein n=1 Tax=Pluteus cervinus TaxID=181527 RepID=A0ACD3B082_9AGAR|nr:hypothetical protein BDN72DRAFT_877697 [Pluteus cervinus]
MKGDGQTRTRSSTRHALVITTHPRVQGPYFDKIAGSIVEREGQSNIGIPFGDGRKKDHQLVKPRVVDVMEGGVHLRGKSKTIPENKGVRGSLSAILEQTAKANHRNVRDDRRRNRLSTWVLVELFPNKFGQKSVPAPVRKPHRTCRYGSPELAS